MHDVIFSDKSKFKFIRHGLFCTSILFYSLLRNGIMYPAQNFLDYFPSYFSFAIFWTLLILVFSYITVYVFVPNYLYKKKYVSFCISMILFGFTIFMVSAFQIYSQVNKTFSSIAGIRSRDIFQVSTLIRSMGNPPLVCGLLLSLKSLKNWYVRKMEKETLTRANMNAELQLLKSQIHPHFLFNTLNNIYSYSLSNKSEAAVLVKKLKQTVHYMVAECNHPYVPLQNELNMIANYIELEKIRYGNRLSMQVELLSPEENQLIAPLLMIPFVENSFKHGVSQMLEHPWITLKINAVGNVLYFFLSNSKPIAAVNPGMRKGIGLENVKKRLELLYPGKHSLHIQTTEDTFTVQMEVSLVEYILREPKSDIFSMIGSNRNNLYAV